MGDDEEKWGKPQLRIGGIAIDATTDSLRPDGVEIEPVKIPKNLDYNKAPGKIEGSFDLVISASSWRRICWSMALHEAREQAAEFNQWIKERMKGSRLPRKSKKWCKKVIALRIANGFGIEAKHLLKYIKPKKR